MLAAALLWPLFSGCPASHHNVHRIANGTDVKNLQGIVYALPRTSVVLDIPVVKTVRKAGIYAGFVGLLDPLDRHDIIAADATEYTIGRTTIASTTEMTADPTSVFLVEVDAGAMHDRSTVMELTEAGVLTSANTKDENRTFDFLVQSFQAVAGVVKPFIPFAGAATKTPPPSEAQAQPEVDRLRALRAARLNLLTSSNPAWPAETFKAMLAEYDRQEREILSLFLGSEESTIWTGRYTLLPLALPFRERLLRLSPVNGVSDAAYGALVPPQFLNRSPAGDEVDMMIEIDTLKGQMATVVADAAPGSSQADHGFYYRVPAQGRFVVKKEKGGVADALYASPVFLSQFGATLSLPRDVGSVGSRIDFSLHPSGALRKIDVSGSGTPGSSSMEKLGTAAADLASTIQEHTDELNILKREREILEESKKIRELKQTP
jgi:hypothetical protein